MANEAKDRSSCNKKPQYSTECNSIFFNFAFVIAVYTQTHVGLSKVWEESSVRKRSKRRERTVHAESDCLATLRYVLT